MARSEAMQKFAQNVESFPEVQDVSESNGAVLVKADSFPAKLFRLAERHGMENSEHLISYSTGNSVLSFK